jgi:hypothetical protein
MSTLFTLNKSLYTRRITDAVDLLVLLLAPLSGLLHPNAKVYYESVVYHVFNTRCTFGVAQFFILPLFGKQWRTHTRRAQKNATAIV